MDFEKCPFWKRWAPRNPEDPFNKIFKILNTGPISIKKHECIFANMVPISITKHQMFFCVISGLFLGSQTIVCSQSIHKNIIVEWWILGIFGNMNI